MGMKLFCAAALVFGLAAGTAVAQDSLAALGFPTNADWSDLSREATIDQVAAALARINENYQQDYIAAVDAGAFLEPVFNATLVQVVALRDAVASNPYVRISSFTITAGIPPSVSVEFTFPPVEGRPQ
jgi:hypothetical protein